MKSVRVTHVCAVCVCVCKLMFALAPPTFLISTPVWRHQQMRNALFILLTCHQDIIVNFDLLVAACYHD